MSVGRSDGGQDIGGRGGNYQDEGPHEVQISQGQFCQLCDAWRGSLGAEPRLDMYVAHLVEIFRDVRRVLRDNGVLMLNLGDSYFGSGKGPTGHNGIGDQIKRQGFHSPKGASRGPGPKNLMGIPWRVALALQADGWFLRSAMPWLKANAMPESVRDRPTTAHEYVFLLAKSKKYYWDTDAIRVPHKQSSLARYEYGHNSWAKAQFAGSPTDKRHQGGKQIERLGDHMQPSGRNYRTTDAFVAPLDHAITEARNELARLEEMRDTQGLLLDEHGNPVALRVNPGNFKGSHFATFPVGLVEPFVRAGSSERGECPECGKVWIRVVERGKPSEESERPQQRRAARLWEKSGLTEAHLQAIRAVGCADAGKAQVTMTGYGKNRLEVQQLADEAKKVLGGYYREFLSRTEITTGWTPSCTCPPADPVPQIILDIFGGAMTTMMVADRLGRNGIACELNPDYAEMGRQRLIDDGGMFMDVRVE